MASVVFAPMVSIMGRFGSIGMSLVSWASLPKSCLDGFEPLPGRRGDQPADDRRHGPEGGHGRIQGDRDPGGEAAALEAGDNGDRPSD